jgi:hypothetical protein
METFSGWSDIHTVKYAIDFGRLLTMEEKSTYAIHVLEKALVAAEIMDLSILELTNIGLNLIG